MLYRLTFFVGSAAAYYLANRYKERSKLIPPLKIQPDEVSKEQIVDRSSIDKLNLNAFIDDKRYNIGVARLNLIAVFHSGIAFKPVDGNSWIVFARQKPIFYRNNSLYKRFILFPKIMQSSVDNEGDYWFFDFFKKYNIEALPNEVSLKGVEIKDLIKLVNDTICNTQYCDLLFSNCYSASTFILANVIKTIDKRTDVSEDDKIKSLKIVYQSLIRLITDNLSQGVTNNSLVRNTVLEAEKILIDKNLLNQLTNLNPTPVSRL